MSVLGYLGQGALGLLLLSSFVKGLWRKAPFLSQLSKVHFICATTAFLVLMIAHVLDDFALVNVVKTSHTMKPFLYKISGVWGSHEGSMLLWVWVLSAYSFFVERNLPMQSEGPLITGALLQTITVGFVLFTLWASDPFAQMALPAQEGQDLNPLLQDPSLAVHPPCLYAGYVGFSVPFSLAVAFLFGAWGPNLTLIWHAAMRQWTLVSWCFLTLGLGLGSFWAYYELGWGGWWFWDPVENVALLPWLCGTALLHSLRATAQQKVLSTWTLFLAILTFGLCLFGTFFVRSGLLTSVHNFAIDPQRGLFLLILSAFICVPAFGLFFYRLPSLRSQIQVAPLSRSGMLLLNTLFLSAGGLTILLGTIYPLVIEPWGEKITVGAPYFNTTFVPMMLPVLFLMGIGPWIEWRFINLKQVLSFVVPMAVISLAAILLGLWFLKDFGLLAIFLLGTAGWIMLTTGRLWIRKIKEKRQPISFHGMCVAHFGLAICVVGMTVASVAEKEILTALNPGESVSLRGHVIQFQGVRAVAGPNYKAQEAQLDILVGSQVVGRLKPQRRLYPVQGILHPETAIYTTGLSHFYIILGDKYESGQWSLQIFHKPWINLIWIGVGLLVLGGLLVLMARLRWFLAAFFLALIGSSPSLQAMNAHEQLQSAALEAKAKAFDQKVVCPQCQGQTIQSSPARMAIFLRRLIRKRLSEGRSMDQIQDELLQTYGSAILTKPPQTRWTFLLWIGPWILLFFILMGVFFRKRTINNKVKKTSVSISSVM